MPAPKATEKAPNIHEKNDGEQRKASPTSHHHASSRSSSPVPAIPGPTPVFEPSPVPPDVWTQKMVYMWTASREGSDDSSAKKKLITIEDVAKLGESDKPLKINSPRSIEACLHLGVDPVDIAYRPLESFQSRGLPLELQKLKYEHYEKLRKEKIKKLQAERSSIIHRMEEEGAAAMAAASNVSHNKYKCPKDFQEKEKQRLEVIRRRQQRELEQMAKFEAQRLQLANENQARADAEKKAEERKRLEKARKDKEWQADMRKRELQKMREEEALEKKSKQMAAERYLREQQQLALEQKQLKQQKRDAMRKEQERIAKQEEFRRQMEKILEAQQELLRKKQEEMQQKDLERKKMMEEQNKERVRQHLEARKHADARHANAVANFHELMRKREEDYNKRQEELKIKLKKQDEEHKILEAEKKKKEELKEQQRLEVIREAQAERDRRVQELILKAEAADLILQNFIMKRQLEHARKVVERQLEFEDKHARAESVKRVKALHRFHILQRVEAETERVQKLLESKAKQEERHRRANVKLSIHRQNMLQQMEKLAINKKWGDTLNDGEKVNGEDSKKQNLK